MPLLLQRGSEGSNPAIVTLKGTAKDQLLSHDRSLGGRWKGRERREEDERGRSNCRRLCAGDKTQLSKMEEQDADGKP